MAPYSENVQPAHSRIVRGEGTVLEWAAQVKIPKRAGPV